MKFFGVIAIAVAVATTAGCASKPTGPKLYNDVFLVTKADGVITVPVNLSKEFIESIRARAAKIAQTEVAQQGDMNIVESCGPKVMKVVQEITSVSMSENLVSSFGFFGGVTQDTKQETRISTSMRVEDCQSGKLIFAYDFDKKGTNPAEILLSAVNHNISRAYRYQYPR
mgnify:CR=1 FL=1